MLLRRKTVAITLLLGISLLILVNLASAKEEVEFYVRTDKPYYGYGDQGTLFITVRNREPGPIAVKRIEVRFPWYGWYHEQWSGNYTEDISSEEQTVNENSTKTYSLQFTVPSESRDRWKENVAKIWITYMYGDEKISTPPQNPITIPINMAVPVYNENIMPIYYMTAVLTVLVIIVIIELYLVWRRLRRLAPVPTAA